MSDETEEQSELTGSAEVTPAEVEELKRQLAEKQDRLLRALAEVDNVKRRTQREREDYVRYANQPPDTVVAELTAGYMLNGRVLRPGQVLVAAAPDEDAA